MSATEGTAHRERAIARSARKGRKQPRAANGHFKSRLTAEVREAILTAVRAGNYLEVAVRYAGVAESTFWEWVRRGRDGDARYAPFVAELDKAQAQSEVRDLALVGKAAEDPDRWTAAAWRLERRYPDRYGRPQTRVKVEGAVGIFPAISPERLRDALEAGEISLEQAESFALVWRVLMGRDLPAGEPQGALPPGREAA